MRQEGRCNGFLSPGKYKSLRLNEDNQASIYPHLLNERLTITFDQISYSLYFLVFLSYMYVHMYGCVYFCVFVVYLVVTRKTLRRKDKEPINFCSKEIKKLGQVHYRWHEQNPKSRNGSGNYQVDKAESVRTSVKRRKWEQGASRDLWKGLRTEL